jgi:hypothetical protein
MRGCSYSWVGAGKRPYLALTNSLSGVSGAAVATAQTSSSTGYTDLATVGPQVTVNTGSRALVLIGAGTSNSTAPAFCYVGVAVTGASAIAAADAQAAVWLNINNANTTSQLSFAYLLTGLTPGSNTFTAKYKVSAGTGTFSNRTLAVIPLFP